MSKEVPTRKHYGKNLQTLSGKSACTLMPTEWGINMRNSEICVQLQGYDLVMIMETWYNGSYIWSVAMEGNGLFRKDKPGRRGSGVALYVTEQLEYMEPTESL